MSVFRSLPYRCGGLCACPIVPQCPPTPAGWQREWAAAIFRAKLLGPPQRSDCIFRRVGGREGDRGVKLFSEHMSLLATEQDCGHNTEGNNSCGQRKSLLCFRWDVCNCSGNLTPPDSSTNHSKASWRQRGGGGFIRPGPVRGAKRPRLMPGGGFSVTASPRRPG